MEPVGEGGVDVQDGQFAVGRQVPTGPVLVVTRLEPEGNALTESERHSFGERHNVVDVGNHVAFVRRVPDAVRVRAPVGKLGLRHEQRGPDREVVTRQFTHGRRVEEHRGGIGHVGGRAGEGGSQFFGALFQQLKRRTMSGWGKTKNQPQ